ncbi:MAG: DoxX family protein [Bacteroidota bacterium]
MKYALLLGRILFSLIFLMSSFGHFGAESIGYAAAKGVPAANILVPITGLMELFGAITIIAGYKAKWGAWTLVAFLLPVTFIMHNFWTIEDAMAKQMDMIACMKNISMTGGALIIAYFGTGPLSVENKNKGTAA